MGRIGILINSIGIIFSIIGTVVTLWMPLMTKDSKAGTWGELKKRCVTFSAEKKMVKIGIAVICIGGTLQILSQFL